MITRSFTEEQWNLIMLALIAIRPHVSEDEREAINDLIRSAYEVTP